MTDPYRPPHNHRPNQFTSNDFTALCGCGRPSITHTIPGLYEFQRQGYALPVACEQHHREALLFAFPWPKKPTNYNEKVLETNKEYGR